MLKLKIIFFILLQISLFAKINAIVSIAPEVTFLKAIAKDKVNISLMVKAGSSPHNYEPKPSQMKDISKANLYFAIGVEFEDIWLDKFKSQNMQMNIIDLSANIQKVNINSKHTNHKHKDPHIWTNPMNVKIIANNIYQALIQVDDKNKLFYKENLEQFIQSIDNLDIKIKNILSKTKYNSSFMVFHPAWGYFAKQYNLIQLPVEVEGKTPKPRELVKLILKAKQHNIKAIFTQPEFSHKVAKQISLQLNIPVIKTSPLSTNWSENLLNLAKAIAK